jgi:hypothetical protein
MKRSKESDMANLDKYINVVFKIWILIFIGLAWDNPQAIGEWKANVDIAYEDIWIEYIADCDCTEPLE